MSVMGLILVLMISEEKRPALGGYKMTLFFYWLGYICSLMHVFFLDMEIYFWKKYQKSKGIDVNKEMMSDFLRTYYHQNKERHNCMMMTKKEYKKEYEGAVVYKFVEDFEEEV